MSTTLIVSAPHQLCKPNTPRMCDLAAGIATEMFCQAAIRHRNLECMVLLGDEHRVNHDLNRKVSRGTPFRKKLDQLLSMAEGSNCVVIDIHSFPDKYLVEAGDINFFKQGEIAPEIVLLHGPLDEFRGKSICNTIYKALVKGKITSKIIRGITVNDILNQSSEYDLSGILIEFNEKFKSEPDRLYDICKIIASSLSSIK